MTMPRIEGYAPANTCRRCEYLGAGTGNYGMGCELGDARDQEEHFPKVQACDKFSDWYANTAKNMMAIASEFTNNPAEAVAGFLAEGAREGDSND